MATATWEAEAAESTSRRPLRFGVSCDQGLWTNGFGELVRIRALDLRELTHKVAEVREDSPHAVVVVDIEVMIASDVRAARAAMRELGHESVDTMAYVGTPTGLAGLIMDIYAMGIADGAVLLPVGNGAVLELIRDSVVPELEAVSAA